MSTRTIGKLAQELSIHVETIRFYEKKGLIQQPLKPSVGYRHYPDAILKRIRFIQRAQGLGFTLNEIQNLLSLSDQPCSQVQTMAEYKLTSVKAKIYDLKRLQQALQQLLSQCRDNTDLSHCPIIDALLPTE